MGSHIGDVGIQITVNLVKEHSESVLSTSNSNSVKSGKFNTSWRLLFTNSLVFHKIVTGYFILGSYFKITHLTDHTFFRKKAMGVFTR